MSLNISLAEISGERPPAGRRCDVSFIVPSLQAERTLASSLESIRAAAPRNSELIVVDDGSFDGTIAVAQQLADMVISRPCQGGAARSRNDGAGVAAGDVLVFVDADVTVTPEAVAGALRHIADGADAVFGAYEALPPPEVRNVATTYKNILHHFTHLRGAGEATTFWSGFGAVRRDAFMAVNGFEPAVTTGADVEDIHLGYRLRAAGHRIVLDPTLQVRHHKRYTVRGVITSDVFHRAVPWTRAMFQLRTFSTDLNLRRNSMLAGFVSLAVPSALVAALWFGLPALIAAAAFATTWVAMHRDFLAYVRREWSLGGAAASAALLYLYYLYGVLGFVLGTTAFVLRHDRRSTLNRLRLETPDRPPPEVAVTLAVVSADGEPIPVLKTLPRLEGWWELIVVGSRRPTDLPPGARFIQAAEGSTRNEMRQAALGAATGEMFATLDAQCVPVDGWLERARELAATNILVAAGPFEHDRRSAAHRAEQIVRYWQWRPERPASWLVHHPNTNACFRTDLARALGGFEVEGALILRLAAFGARPVRFDPALRVRMTGSTPVGRWLKGVAGVARLRASASARYFDIGLLHRMALVVLSPLSGLLALGRIVSGAIRERSADRTFWLGLPLVVVGLAFHWIGRDVGVLLPGSRGGVVPRAASDLGGLHDEVRVG